jgi:FkbM family methyltransferase
MFIQNDWLAKLGQKEHQQLFEELYQFAILGMNIGTGGEVKNSGEIAVIKYLQEHFKARERLIIFDVGANVGEYSQLLIEMLKSEAVIYAFEPSAETFFDLIVNTAEFPSILPHNIGFSNQDGRMLLYSCMADSGLASVYQRRLEHFHICMDRQEEIKVRTIDSFCAEQNISRIHFLKLDVEGHELSVLEGAAGMLAQGTVDFIQFEFGGCNIDSRTYFQDFYYLLKDSYQIYRIVKDGLVLISAYKEGYELFTTTNYLAQRREIKNNSF